MRKGDTLLFQRIPINPKSGEGGRGRTWTQIKLVSVTNLCKKQLHVIITRKYKLQPQLNPITDLSERQDLKTVHAKCHWGHRALEKSQEFVIATWENISSSIPASIHGLHFQVISWVFTQQKEVLCSRKLLYQNFTEALLVIVTSWKLPKVHQQETVSVNCSMFMQ